MLSKDQKEEILNDFENYIDDLRISNKMWTMNQDEITMKCLEQLEVILDRFQKPTED